MVKLLLVISDTGVKGLANLAATNLDLVIFSWYK
jgi:hypothetical protein